ncbi:hypothetical protein J3R83DRAFT_2357 [Lanmaoa asiatica]|nr:hypothetical protein J3R83DRAFT_2357 [Lanmaoa asiatica]
MHLPPRLPLGIEQVSGFEPLSYVSTIVPSALSHSYSASFLDLNFDLSTPAHLTPAPLVPNSRPTLPTPDSHQDNNNDLLETSSMSCEVDMHSILPDPSLGLDERQRIFDLWLRKLVDLATSTGLRIPADLIPSSSPHDTRNNSLTGLESIADGDWDSRVGSSTSMFRSTSNWDLKKTCKIDKIKERLVTMLRDIGFSVGNGWLPWSTLEGDLGKKGYMILNWPQGVFRDRDKGVSGLSAEDADKLHDALFLDRRRLQFVRCDEGKLLSMYGTTIEGLLKAQPDSADNNRVTSLTHASGSDGSRESDHSSLPPGDTQLGLD